MPFMRGESLRDRMQREGRLPVADAVRIALEVSSALECAHRKASSTGIIKPDNILIEGGFAIVADFGIVRVRSAAENPSITQTGTSLGTPLYMSPEQALGADDIDGRSDLYSLACVLVETLAGHSPYATADAHASLARPGAECSCIARRSAGA